MLSHRVNSINFGEKPTVMLYTNIIHHVGTPKKNKKNSTFFMDSDFQDFQTTIIIMEYSNIQSLEVNYIPGMD